MNTIRSEMFNLWKTSVENATRTLTTLQDQGHRFAEVLLAQEDTLHEEAKKLTRESLRNMKETQLAYINSINQKIGSFSNMVDKK